MSHRDPDEHARELAAEALGDGDPTAWFESLYAAAAKGEAVVPWDRGGPHRLLVRWAHDREPDGGGRRALVVGAGLGDDAELVAGLDFDTVAFDVAASAVDASRRRFPDSRVQYVQANLLDPPPEWRRAFDLVVESLTVQSLPREVRPRATANVKEMVAPGGTLVVIASAHAEAADLDAGPPWPLTRAELEAFAGGGLEPVRIEDVRYPEEPELGRWLAEFRRAGRD